MANIIIMDETPYSKRELDGFFTNLGSKIEESHKDLAIQLDRIEVNTNDYRERVSRLEAFRNIVSGALTIVTIIVVPLFGWMLYQIAILPQTIQSVVAQALLPYAK